MSGNSLEEIKLVVEHVKCKKVEGSLYLMSERLAWMPKQKTSSTISHHYVDIKTQKISTEGKAKIQLQVVLHDDTSSTFHFISPAGSAQQLKDRDQVKDILASLLPKFRQKISKELEDKKRILVDNPHLYQLYNDLVVGQIVSAEDFWRNFVDLNKLKEVPENQLTGVSQGFMANICPKSDGSSGLVYNISYDDIQSIFKTYPEVKLKYLQNVPNKMTEKDFWTKFFQSYYFRRDQINSTANDLFADCAIKDDLELRTKALEAVADPLVGLNVQKDMSSEDGFGLTDFLGNKASNIANQNLIKRYNYYSMRVLSAMEENVHGNKKETIQLKNSKNETAPPKKKLRLNEEIIDLTNENLNQKLVSLNLTHIDRYFYAPKTDETKLSQVENILKSHDVKSLCEETLTLLNDWNLNISKISNPSLAIGILVELSPGSQLMQSNGVRNLKDEIPRMNQEEIKSLYLCSCEMLKNFHRAFPPKNSEQDLRLKSMKENLENYYEQKVAGLHERLSKENFPWNLTLHLENMFKIAFSKYNNWQMRQSNLS